MIWSVWQPSQKQPWDVKRVKHLLRRSGFSPDWKTIQAGLSNGVEKTIDQVLDFGPQDESTQQFESLAKTIGEAAVGADSADRLRAWWIFRMIMTPKPLEERLTLLWHNHFATSNYKVNSVAAMYEQNLLMRTHCLGKFSDLLRSAVKSPAMMIWLDASTNRKEHPNENLGRELLELFTLGEGNYNERDVTEAARSLTGWTVTTQKVHVEPAYHDPGKKTILGTTHSFNGDGLLDFLVKQPATARRIAWRLCRMFFGEQIVDEPAMKALADGLLAHDLDLKWAVETILRSELFFSDANIRSRIASPVEYVIGAIRCLEMNKHPPSTFFLAAQLRHLGQDLFHPPSVFGWPEGRAWIDTRSVLARTQFAEQLVEGQFHQSKTPLDVSILPKQYGLANSRKQTQAFFADLIGNEVDSASVAKAETNANDEDTMRRQMIAKAISSIDNQII